MEKSISDRFRLVCTAIANRVDEARRDDRGGFSANLAWTGAMVLAAVTIAGIIVAKAKGYAEGVEFGP